MKRLPAAIAAAILFVNAATAQLNESDTSLFQLRANINDNYQKGNVEVLSIRSKPEFSTGSVKQFVFKSQNSSLYQSYYSKEADNDIFSRNFLYYQPFKKVYPFAIGYVSTNYRRKIDVRYFFGGGVTLQVVNSYKNVMKLSANTVYEKTKLRLPPLMKLNTMEAILLNCGGLPQG